MKPEPEDIIVRPILSERSIRSKKKLNKVAFEVVKEANKPEIKKAVEKLFSVKVKHVNVVRVPGKFTRSGFKATRGGYKSDWKKAIVTLSSGDKIDVFEGN